MKDYPSIDRLAELQQMIADFSAIKRAIHIADKGRFENDVEHSYGLAMTCWFLASKIAPDLDLHKIISYALVHDLVELHTGDTFAFDEKSIKTKSQREEKSFQRIKQDWQDFPGMLEAIENYESKSDKEANFVYTIDKMLPAIMVELGEKGLFWNRHKITKEMHESEKYKKMRQSEEALPYLDLIIQWLAKRDNFYKPNKK